MSDARLAQPFAGAGTRASAALDLAQLLADAAQGIEERDCDLPPVSRVVPDVGVFALGDQVAVTGTDLVVAAGRAGADAEVWAVGQRVLLAVALARAVEAVRALRLAL
jgi:hypothetical protein